MHSSAQHSARHTGSDQTVSVDWVSETSHLSQAGRQAGRDTVSGVRVHLVPSAWSLGHRPLAGHFCLPFSRASLSSSQSIWNINPRPRRVLGPIRILSPAPYGLSGEKRCLKTENFEARRNDSLTGEPQPPWLAVRGRGALPSHSRGIDVCC